MPDRLTKPNTGCKARFFVIAALLCTPGATAEPPDAGPIDLFAKVGYIFWDVEVSSIADNVSEDGSDLGYGAGVSFSLGSIKIRGELEVYDVDDADLSMLSLGILYQFN